MGYETDRLIYFFSEGGFCMSDFYRLTGVKKSYVKKNEVFHVLDDISFDLKPKEFITIMGNSGCGKSTLIKIMEGIEPCDAGEITLEGVRTGTKPSKAMQRKFGVMFQSDNLLDWKTVYLNVRLPLDVFGMKKELDVETRVMDALTLVGLENYKDCLPSELSGGMRQRAAIARALVTNPDILMLDQPFGALDAITRKVLNEKLLTIWRQTQKTCVMVTNSVYEALYLGNRVLILSDAPAKIVEEIEVPLSYEERLDNIGLNPVYLKLRERLNRIVRSLH
jgi:NitT/TauT family transport system ATP-binding protein